MGRWVGEEIDKRVDGWITGLYDALQLQIGRPPQGKSNL